MKKILKIFLLFLLAILTMSNMPLAYATTKNDYEIVAKRNFCIPDNEVIKVDDIKKDFMINVKCYLGKATSTWIIIEPKELLPEPLSLSVEYCISGACKTSLAVLTRENAATLIIDGNFIKSKMKNEKINRLDITIRPYKDGKKISEDNFVIYIVKNFKSSYYLNSVQMLKNINVISFVSLKNTGSLNCLNKSLMIFGKQMQKSYLCNPDLSTNNTLVFLVDKDFWKFLGSDENIHFLLYETDKPIFYENYKQWIIKKIIDNKEDNEVNDNFAKANGITKIDVALFVLFTISVSLIIAYIIKNVLML